MGIKYNLSSLYREAVALMRLWGDLAMQLTKESEARDRRAK